MKDFVDKRLCEEPELEFVTPIKKMKLKTFSSLKNKVKDKVIPIKSLLFFYGFSFLVK